MHRSLLALALVVAAPAAAQSASSKLYAKVEDGHVLAAIQVTPDVGCWVYDDDDDSGGKPTEVTFSGGGVSFGEPWFPEPKTKPDGLGGTSKVHSSRFLIYAAGEVAAGEPDLDELEVRVDGLVCNERLCVGWSETLSVRGAGTDRVWDGFPRALLASAPVTDGVALDPVGAPAPRGGVQEGGWSPAFPPGEKVAARLFVRESDDGAEAAVQLAVAPGFHVYHGPEQEDVGPGIGQPTVLSIEGGGDVAWGEWVYPEPHKYEDPLLEHTWTHEGVVAFGVRGELFGELDPLDALATVDGQVCDDKGCIPFTLELEPEESEAPAGLFTAAFAGGGAHAGPDEGAEPDGAGEGATPRAPKDPDQEQVADGGGAGTVAGDGGGGTRERDGLPLGQFLLLAIGAGLITLLMPCTYPMIPITISFFTKQASARDGKVLPLALAYGTGIVLTFVVIGALAGPIIVPFAQHWITNVTIGVLFVFFAIVLFGLVDLRPPRFMMNAAGKASTKGGYSGVFLMGLCLVITSFTCTAPFVGSLIGAGAGSGGNSMLKIVMGMAVFGLTMATPFVFLALLPGKLQAIPQAGAWMDTLKVFMGFVELGASLKFFSNADIVQDWGLLPREVFLALWAGIAIVAAIYLFGRINLKGANAEGEVGPVRMLGGVASVLFAAYCWMGLVGYRLDGTMTALVPPPDYTRGLVDTWKGAGRGADADDAPTVIKDDYDRALAVARQQDKLLLVNFTGHS